MVDCVVDGDAAVEGLVLEHYDMVIVDLGLPGMSGIEVVRRLRARKMQLPVLILTAEGALSRRVEGLNAGADDYMTKPFEVEELAARIRALMRRSGKSYALARWRSTRTRFSSPSTTSPCPFPGASMWCWRH